MFDNSTQVTPDQNPTQAEPGQDLAQATSGQDLAQATSGQPPAQVTPGQNPAQAEPGQDPAQVTPDQNPTQAEPSQDPAQAEPGQGPTQAEPDQDLTQAEPSQDPAQAEPGQGPTQAEPDQDLTQATPGQPPAQATPGQGPTQATPDQNQQASQPTYTVTQSDDYFHGGQFYKDIASFRASSNLVTGYKLLDRIQPLYSGLYCLGAISSLGKTSFMMQLADQVAATGQQVLYYSFEQNQLELFSKSLSRGFYMVNQSDARQNGRPSTYPTPSSLDIRCGRTPSYPQDVNEMIDYYTQTVGERVCIVHGDFSVTVEDIVGITEQFIKQLGVKPLVIVDYLQIVAPSVISGRVLDTKASIDHIVHTLKALQSKHNLTVLAISSLNRQNYLTPIDFESFKESGGIEYTADVIWGLQLSILEDEKFYHHFDNTGKKRSETTIAEKRKMIQAAKGCNPREIDLVCLKNRYGRSSYSVPFQYFPASDYFRPPYDPNDPDTQI